MKQTSPWHHLGRIDSKDCPITERRMASVLWQTMVSIKSPNHHVLVGPRRTGKTTILRQTVRRLIAEGVHPKRIWELQMDDAIFKNESLKDIVRIMVNATDADHNDPLYLMIDEIAHASNWQIWLKLIHDNNLPVKIAATSSAAATLTRGRVESGFGRWRQHYIFPSQLNEYMWLRSGLQKDTPLFTPDTPGWMADCRSLAERLLLIPEGTKQTPEEDELLREYSLFGGLPEFPVARGMANLPNIPKIALTAPEIDALTEAHNILKEAVLQKALTLDLYLEGEEVRDTDSLRTLANYLAFAPAQKMSVQNLCNHLDVTRPTIGRWLTFLEDALIIFRLIRDTETAQIAIQSALTGHLVFTTVHANNVIDVLGRFLNMGVEAYQFVSALNCVLAQRLVRTICAHCKRPVEIAPKELEESGLDAALAERRTFREGGGCVECGGTGYRGRTAICELLDLSDGIRELILARRPATEIRQAARSEGMRLLRESAVERAVSGVTTLREINKVTFVE